MVFCSATKHRRSANVDLLNHFPEGRPRLFSSLLEGVEVDHHHVDVLDLVFDTCRSVLGTHADFEQAAVDPGVESFDSAVHHFREAGVVADLDAFDTLLGEEFGCASG